MSKTTIECQKNSSDGVRGFPAPETYKKLIWMEAKPNAWKCLRPASGIMGSSQINLTITISIRYITNFPVISRFVNSFSSYRWYGIMGFPVSGKKSTLKLKCNYVMRAKLVLTKNSTTALTIPTHCSFLSIQSNCLRQKYRGTGTADQCNCRT